MSDAPVVESYTRHALGAGDRAEVLALMRLSLGDTAASAKTEVYWDWKHEANPFGASLVLGARGEAGELAALRVLMRWRFERPGGAVVEAVRPVDTATHPEHRRRGLFKTLTLYAVEAVEREGAAFLFNTPNDNSRPGYLKMGWGVVARWPLYVRPAGWRRWVGRGERGPSWSDFLAEHEAHVAELVAGHERGRRSVGYRTPRSVDYLRWRYTGLPDLTYHAVPWWRGGELVGVVLGRYAPGFGGRTTFVVTDAFAREPKRLGGLFRYAASRVAADYLTAHFAEASDEYRGLRKAGFVRMPGRGYTFVARPLGAGVQPDPLDASSWDLSIGELELF